jgi:hypothetical protein
VVGLSYLASTIDAQGLFFDAVTQLSQQMLLTACDEAIQILFNCF